MGIEEGVLVEILSDEVSDIGVGKEARFKHNILIGSIYRAFYLLFIFLCWPICLGPFGTSILRCI